MLDTGMKARIEAKGVVCVEVAGWATRTAGATYSPRGTVNHHTAGGSKGVVPSLATVIYGRPDVPGPLCQVLQSREVGRADRAYLVAAGKANHAGLGGWRGVSGNSNVSGVEVEHVGNGMVSVARLEVSARIQAALLEAPGSSRDAGMCCQHKEWAPTRKVDFRDLAPWTPDSFRGRVAYWIGRTADKGDVFMAGLNDAEQRELLRLTRSIFNETAADGDDCRLAEATIGVRKLLEPQAAPKAAPVGYFAKATTDDGMVSWVTADNIFRLTMVVGSDLHEHLKKVCRDAGYPERAQVLPDAVLSGIVVVNP